MTAVSNTHLEAVEDDEYSEFTLRAAENAAEGYQKIAEAIPEQINLMSQYSGILINTDKYKSNAARLDRYMEFLVKVQTTIKNADSLIARIKAAIPICQKPLTGNAADATTLQRKLTTLQEGPKGYKVHANEFITFSTAMVNTCYNYLAERRQIWLYQFAFWKINPNSHSTVLQQYRDLRNIESIAEAAVSPNGAGPSGDKKENISSTTAIASSPTAVEVNSKKSEKPPSPINAASTAIAAETSLKALFE